MKRETYEKVFQTIQKFPYGKEGIVWLSKAITLVTALLYFAVLLYVAIQHNFLLLTKIVVIPAISFLGVSLCRKIIHAPRPYEVYGFTPLIPKEKKGESFPSRHVFSIFVVATTLCRNFWKLSCILWGMGIVLAILRVVSGVHFLRDVGAGMVLGIVSGLLIFLL